jgi:hypothetical protein
MQPVDLCLAGISSLEDQPGEVGLVAAGFSPRAMTYPGGIDGRGVSSQIRRSDNSFGHRAAFKRATGNNNATLRAPSSSA